MDEKSLKIALLGDSLTEYFDWQGRFPQHCVTNLGVAGETVEGLLGRLETIRSTIRSADIIFIMTGINNIAMEEYAIHGPIEEIVRETTSWSLQTKSVLQSVLPVRLPWIDNRVIREINEALKQIARKYGASYLDIFSRFVDSQGNPVERYLLDDGVHVSDKGYEVWSQAMEDFLEDTVYKRRRTQT